MSTRVSVVVATHNRRATLARALDSVDRQCFPALEMIVVDDRSTDGTIDWLRTERPDVWALVNGGTPGAAAARNLGIERARGEIVAFLDDDDVWLPGYLRAQVEHLEAAPRAAVSYADHVEVDAAGRRFFPDKRTLLPQESQFVQLLADCPIHTSSVAACRRDAFETYGRLDERLRIVHDWEWYARVVAKGGVVVHLARQLVERGVPGGLTAHRSWYREESVVLTRVLAGRPADERLVRTYRALFFGRVALAKGDVVFGLARVAEALRRSPSSSARLSVAAVRRRLSPPTPAVAPA